jgi:hypothetical protein
MTKPTTPEALAKMISKGFVSADKKFAALAEDIVGIKDDIADVKATLADHTRDLNIIRNDVKTNLDKRLQLEVRVTAIEKHLGLNKKIAA